MPTPNEILQSFTREDWDRIALEIYNSSQARQKRLEAFWQSDVCTKMIEDIISLNIGFDNEQFSYEPAHIKNQLGWEHLSNEIIEEFIAVMANTQIGVTEPLKKDDDCDFENYIVIKKGIEVFSMSGQGTYVSIKPLPIKVSI